MTKVKRRVIISKGIKHIPKDLISCRYGVNALSGAEYPDESSPPSSSNLLSAVVAVDAAANDGLAPLARPKSSTNRSR